MRIAIVGVGYTGAAVAVSLLKALPVGAAITIYEPEEDLGRGIAYARGPDHHLLNVAAHTIALTPGDEGYFTDWALERYSDAASYREEDGAYFFPRAWFGTYVGEVLSTEIRNNPATPVEHRREIAQAISLTGDALTITSESGRSSYDKLILAIGNSPTPPLRVLEPIGSGDPHVAQSAWGFDPHVVSRDASVVIVGGALTMADVVASLEATGHRGPITCISRNGRRPHVTVGYRPEFIPADGLRMPTTARELVVTARSWAEESQEQCADWRPCVDFIRVNMRHLWRALPKCERARLHRHVRSFWEIHRYRMPPAAHRRIEALAASGRFNHMRARVLGVVPGGVRIESASGVQVVSADVVVNASGFDTSYRTAPASIGDLLSATGISPAIAAREGLAVDDEGRVIGANKAVFRKIYALGFFARANHGDLATVNTIGGIAAGIAADIVS